MNSCRKIGGYFFLFFSIALIVQAKPVIIESSIAPLIASFIPAPKKKTINATITIRMIEIIASHNISPSSPICNFILHLKDVVILLCLVILFGIYSQIFDYCFHYDPREHHAEYGMSCAGSNRCF